MADSSNAYGTAAPLQANIADWNTNQENIGFKYRQEQRDIMALDAQRKAKEQEKNDKLKKDILGNMPKNFDTGSISLNELNGRAINQGVERKYEIYKELQRKDLDDNTRLKLEIESKNIDNLPDNLAVATNQFSGLLKDYKAGVESGKYFRNPDFEKKAMNGFDNYVIGLDNGLPAVGFADRNGDGTVNNLDVIPYEGLLKGDTPWTFQKQFDLDNMAATDAKDVGYNDITTDNNFKSVQEKKPRLNQIVGRAESIVRNPDGSATEAALSQLRKLGLDNTPENLNKVKQYYVDAVLRNTNYTKTEKEDNSNKLAASKAAKEEKNQVTWGIVETPPAYENSGSKPASGYKTIAVQGKTILPALTYYDGKKKETLTNAAIQSYTIGKKENGERYIIAEVVYQDTKSQNTKVEGIETKDGKEVTSTTTGNETKLTRIANLTEKDAKIFALQLGFDNVNQMKDAAKATNVPESAGTNAKQTIEGF